MKFNVNSDEMGKSIQGLAKMVSGKSSQPFRTRTDRTWHKTSTRQ